jgi:hypothetical protein
MATQSYPIAGSLSVPSTVLPYIAVGAAKRQEFQDVVDEFFTDFEAHMWIKGKAGLGKTHTVKTTANNHNTYYIEMPGRQTIWGVMKKISVALHMVNWPSFKDNPTQKEIDALPNVAVHFDDMTGWDDKDFINWLKIALDQAQWDQARYEISLSAQYNQAEAWEQVAIDHFRQDQVPGLYIPFWGKVKFIFTMNHALNDDNDLEDYKERNGIKASKNIVRTMEDRAALFSRVDYVPMDLTKEECWGWLADLTMAGNLCPGASQDQMGEMLTFLWNNWDNLREASARSVVQKMWRHLKKSRNGSHLNRWQQLVK